MTKPFGLAELRRRIRAVLRRAHGRVVEGVRTVGPVTIDQRERQVTVGGSPVRVTFSEYELLACLMERPASSYRRGLLRAIWGDSAYRDPRAIDVHIGSCAEAQERPEEPSLILTVRGAGYRFREQRSGVGPSGCGRGCSPRWSSRASSRLAVAALALLPPLQARLTDQAANDLENATRTDAPLFHDAIVGNLRNTKRARQSPEDRLSSLSGAISSRAFRLRLRTDARVIVASAVPGAAPIFDTDFAGSALPRNEILNAITNPAERTVRRDNQVIVVEPIDVPDDLSLNPVRAAWQATCPATSCS